MADAKRKIFVLVALLGLIGVSVMTTATWAEGEEEYWFSEDPVDPHWDPTLYEPPVVSLGGQAVFGMPFTWYPTGAAPQRDVVNAFLSSDCFPYGDACQVIVVSPVLQYGEIDCTTHDQGETWSGDVRVRHDTDSCRLVWLTKESVVNPLCTYKVEARASLSNLWGGSGRGVADC